MFLSASSVKQIFLFLWIRMLRLSKVNHLKIKSLIRIGMRCELRSFDASSELLAPQHPPLSTLVLHLCQLAVTLHILPPPCHSMLHSGTVESHILDFHTNGTIWYVISGDCLLSFSTFSRFIPIVACVSTSFLSIAGQYLLYRHTVNRHLN